MAAPPFYKTAVFYISVTALLVSLASLGVSVLNTQYFGFVNPDVVFCCESCCESTEEQKDNDWFTVLISNRGKAPAEDVILTIFVNNLHKKPAAVFVHPPYNEFSIVREQIFIIAIKFPVIAPKSNLRVTVSNFLPMNRGADPQCDMFVLYKTGAGRYDMEGGRLKMRHP